MTRRGGLIVVDNVVRGGAVALEQRAILGAAVLQQQRQVVLSVLWCWGGRVNRTCFDASGVQ